MSEEAVQNQSEEKDVEVEMLSAREEAIRDLLTLCAEQNVAIPVKMKAAIIGKDIVEAEKHPGGQSKLQHAIEQRASELATLEDDELFREIREIWKSLKAEPIPIECRIANGSYTVSNPVPEEPLGTSQRSGAEDVEDVDVSNHSSRPQVKTVQTENPIYKIAQKFRQIFVTKSLDVRTKFEDKVIMEGVNLKLESGKIYLILGAPGCGKSTLHKMIANTLRQDKKHVVGGEVTINGIKSSEKGVVWSNLTGYIDQIDRLHKYLTVFETCKFAWECRSGGTHLQDIMDGNDPEVAKMIAEMDSELTLVNKVIQGMGLARVKDTFVGDNETVRGVSGGEKKRVTVSEMTVTIPPVLCCDEISTGLDAATTYDIVNLMGKVSRMTRTIRIVSLLQPPPETVALFDELILLDSGRVIYAGPVDDVVSYFETLGYEIPERMDAADWLQALPTKDGMMFLKDDGEDRTHLTTEEFVKKFNESDLGKSLLEEIEQPCEQTPDDVRDLASSKYKNSQWQSLVIVSKREMLLWWRDKYALRSRIIQDLLMGVIAGTLFWQQNENPGSVLGILFQSMFFISLGSMQRIPEQFDQRGILYKHQDANFFPSWCYVAGKALASIPVALIDSLLFGTISYWFVGLAYNDGASIANYFIFLLMMMCSSLVSTLMFSMFPAAVADKSLGQAAMSVCLVLFILFSGFTVQPAVIPNYWIWAYWINMFAWILRSIVVNEYQSGKYDEEVAPGVTEGESILITFGFTLENGEPFTFVWVWYGLAFCVGISVVCIIATMIFYDRIRFETGTSLGGGHVVDDDENDEVFEDITLPFQRASLTFKDIHYTVTASTSNEKLELLKGIDGYVEAGKMTALMGSSGAGKTTLMDVLSLRKSSGEITGEVRLNGHLQEPQSFRRCTGYVEQFDVQSPQLTIRETVEFSAALRLEASDPAVTPESTKQFVDQTLAMLELASIQDLQVGSDLTGGLSFEQNKRLSIAVELVANPSIIFLDEPTSGLDARAASLVMRGLRRIATGGRAVCATIHQPSIAIFNEFDSLLLLKRGGETVFFGDLGDESCKLIEYLERYPSTKSILPGENPATWMLTTIGAGSSTAAGKPFDYAGSYSVSQLRKDALTKIAKVEAEATDDNLVTFPSKYSTGAHKQNTSVLARAMKIYWRSPTYNLARMMVSVIIALLFGSVYVSQRTPSTEGDMNSRVTTIFIAMLFIAVNAYNTVLGIFEMERNMFYRHKAALMYDFRAVLIAFTIAEIPFILVASALFVIPFYFMLGFSTEAYKFFLYYAFFTLNTGLFTFLGQMMVSLFRNADTAQGFGGLFVGLTALFSGILIRPQNINSFWVFAYWLFPGHYALEGMIASQFHEDNTPITPSQGTEFEAYVLSTTECQDQGGEDCTGTAEEWIQVSFGGNFDYANLWYDFVYLVGVILLSKVVTGVALVKLNYLAK